MIRVISVALVSSILTALYIRILIPYLRGHGRIGLDLHKGTRVEVVEMAGLGMVLGLVSVTSGVHLLWGLDWYLPLISLVTLLTLVGVYDDLSEIRGRRKFLLCFILCLFVFLPLEAEPSRYVLRVVPAMLVPVALALAVAISANAVNILAGFNGLEAGVTAIAASGILAMALVDGSSEAAIVSATLIGCCVGFLYYNRYPARAFPGDVGTLTMGGVLALSAIIVKAEFLLPLLLAPHLLELFCKVRNRFAPKDKTGHANLGPDGKLKPGGYAAFVHFMMKSFPSGERSLVIRIWLVEISLAVVSFAIYLYSRTLS